jgi:hypothetical protein
MPLQAFPLSQRSMPAVQSTVPLGFEPPPQHCWALVQTSPVTRQPLATAHTFTPLPRSVHTWVQQSLAWAQGTPSWPQLVDPVDFVQRPTVPPARSHRPPQQSALEWQMSP